MLGSRLKLPGKDSCTLTSLDRKNELMENSKTVVLIDDEPDVTETLKDLIESETEWRIRTFSDAHRAIDYVGNRDVAVVLCDYLMPEMNGVEVLKRIREISPRTVLMILTAYADKEGAINAINEAGIRYYFEKPWDNEKILSVLKEAIEHKDISKSRLLKTALDEEKHFSQTIVRTAPALIVALDSQGRIVLFNEKCEEVTGYSESEVVGKKIWDFLLPGKNSERVRQIFTDLQHNLPKTLENPWVTKDGKERTIVWNNTLIKKATKTLLVVATGEDVTERRILEARLRQAQKMEAVGTLAGGIAHDFNNILFAILGYAELARNNVPEGNPARANLKEVFKAAYRAKDLVQQILTFSRQTEQKRRPLQIHLIVKEALRLLRSSLPTTIEIRQNIHSKCGTVLADPTEIHQVVMNLCTNAYHAMREKGGVLEVSLSNVDCGLRQCSQADRRNADLKTDDKRSKIQNPKSKIGLAPGHYVRMTVTDAGHGMDRAVMERIFEPYFTTKGPGKGTGMGLALVHGIVKSHCGAITVHSEPEKGTTFDVYLPRIESTVEPEALPSEPLRKGTESVLFVDDEEPLVRMVQQMLKRLGYDVTARTSSVEALETFRAQPDKFDLVITDQTMPNMTGVELAKELMRIRPNVPIILATGFSEMVTPEKARAMGIREYIMKPIIAPDLGNAIRRVLDQENASLSES